MAKLQVLCGFENEQFEDALVKELKRGGQEPVIHVRYSKESVREFLEKNPDCSTVVLTEKMGDAKYTAEELAQLTDKRDVNVVVVISPRLQGTEFVKTLYTANITGAIFQSTRKGVGPKDVAEQILNRRSRKDARVYYGIEGQKLDMGTLDDDTYLEYYRRLVGGDFILKSYIDLCAKMTPQQIADFTKRLPKEELSELCKYEEFHLIMELLKKFGIDLKIKRPKKMMLGFKTMPQLGMSEGGLTFESAGEAKEEPKEEMVKETASEVSVQNKVASHQDSFSADVHASTDNLDELFAMLDGSGKHTEPKAEPAPVVDETPKEEVSGNVVEEIIAPPKVEQMHSEAEKHLQELLAEKERMLEEKERMLEDERRKADEGAKAANRYKEELTMKEEELSQKAAELSQKEEEHKEKLRQTLKDSKANERELSLQHERELRELRKKQNAMEREMAKRGIYEEEEEEEDVYLTATGRHFSFGFVALILLIVAAVAALLLLNPTLLTWGM